MTQSHTSSSSTPPENSLSPPISAVPTTELTLDRLSVLCRPVLEEERSRNPKIAWAGIFGSVQRGTQRPDSDVDFLIGYAAGADFFHEVCDSHGNLQERLPEVLGREVDIVVFTEGHSFFGYVHLEALLTAQTIWGDASWLKSSREVAERLLREGYEALKKARPVASRLRKRLPSSKAEFVSPENKTLRLSILEDALFVITTMKIPKHTFYRILQNTIPWLFAKEDTIRAAIEGEVESSEDLGDIWKVLSDRNIVIMLNGMVRAAEQTFRRGGLVP